MKKALVLAFAVLTALALVSIPVLAAGPYFTLENEGLTLQPALVVGVDWETTIGDALTGPSFGGDFSITFDNILAPIASNNLWSFTFSSDLDWGAVRDETSALIVVNPRRYPHRVEITNASSIENKIIGALEPVEVWGGVRFEYAATHPVPAGWMPVLFFGIDVHWDL